jgi:hypothetical protein
MRSHEPLRTAVRAALAHLKVKLQADLAKRSPEKALRRLHVREEQAHDGRHYAQAPRPYSQSGYTLVTKALPYLVERVNDASIPAADLSPIEQAARVWRNDVIADLEAVPKLSLPRRWPS